MKVLDLTYGPRTAHVAAVLVVEAAVLVHGAGVVAVAGGANWGRVVEPEPAFGQRAKTIAGGDILAVPGWYCTA